MVADRAATDVQLAWRRLALFAVSAAVAAEKTKPRPTASPTGQTVWHDCKEIGVEGKGWTDTLSFYDRLPAKAQGKAPASVWSLSQLSAGLCVRFTTDAPSIQVRWTLLGNDAAAMPHMPATGVSGVDFYVKDRRADDGSLWATDGRRPERTRPASRVPPGEQYLLYLPLYNGVKSVEIGIPKGRKIAAAAASSHQKPIVIYGTSITQGGCASRPGMAWTSIVGRRLDMPVINLGFSGSGKMEPEMADLLAGARSVGLRAGLYLEHVARGDIGTCRAVRRRSCADRIRTRPSCWPKIPASRTNARRRKDVFSAPPMRN